MEYTIQSDKGQKNKAKLAELMKAAGYESFRQFSKDAGIDCSNLYTNLDGKWGMSVKRMFKVANLLGVSITQVIEIFYPDEMAENQRLL